MNRLLSTLIFLTFFLFACNNTQSTEAKKTNPPSVQNTPTQPKTPEKTGGPVVLADAYLPSITMVELTGLWNTCNQMDYIFYDLPISSSVNDSQSAQAHLRHISDTPVSMREKNRCTKPIGRLFFKSDGEDLIEADAYFGGGCAFFVFLKKGKATYSNLMTPEGVNHFNQIIATATGKATPGQ